MPAEFVAKQITAVLSDIGSDAIKIGMLSSTEIIKSVADTLKKFPEQSRHVVVDPVMISTSGSRLLAADAILALVQELLPITFVLTPNVPEAEILLNLTLGSIKSVKDMCEAAQKLANFGPKFILLKGGHLPLKINGKEQVVDVVYNTIEGSWYEIANDYVDTKNTHGTGCTLSAALAGEIAKGVSGKTEP
jgi:hydroxymethylpyrimidine/phosphomethylpyrimidine kinase